MSDRTTSGDQLNATGSWNAARTPSARMPAWTHGLRVTYLSSSKLQRSGAPAEPFSRCPERDEVESGRLRVDGQCRDDERCGDREIASHGGIADYPGPPRVAMRARPRPGYRGGLARSRRHEIQQSTPATTSPSSCTTRRPRARSTERCSGLRSSAARPKSPDVRGRLVPARRVGAARVRAARLRAVCGRAIGPHIALHTADFDGTVERLRARGCAFAFGPGRGPDGIARVIVRDPTGNVVEITDAALRG